MPIKIPFIAEVRNFLKGTGDVESALDDVGSSLDDMTRDAQRAGDRAGDSLEDISDGADDAARNLDRAGETAESSLEGISDDARDAGRDLERRLSDAAEDAGREAEDMGREFTDALDKVSKKSRHAGDSLSDNVTRGTRRSGEAIGEFKSEATQNIAETASSFSGEWEDAAGLVQGTLGGLASAIPGGIGLALAGLGAAAGAFYTKWNANAQKVEERIQAMFEDMIESGNEFTSAQFVNDKIKGILNDAEDAVISYADAQDIAAESGVELSTVLRAYAGDTQAAAQVQDALNAALDKERDRLEGTVSQWDAKGQNVNQNAQQLQDYIGTLDQVNQSTDTAADRAAAYRDAQVSSSEATREYTEALAEMDDAAAEARDQIAENNKTISNHHQLTLENNAALSTLAGEYLDVQDAGRQAGLSTAELNQLQERQYDKFMATAQAAGYSAGEARNLAEELGLIPGDVRTDVNVSDHGSTEDTQREINGLHGTTVEVRTWINQQAMQAGVDAAFAALRVPTLNLGSTFGGVVRF